MGIMAISGGSDAGQGQPRTGRMRPDNEPDNGIHYAVHLRFISHIGLVGFDVPACSGRYGLCRLPGFLQIHIDDCHATACLGKADVIALPMPLASLVTRLLFPSSLIFSSMPMPYPPSQVLPLL